ncbi:hypothetical protein AHiyo8_36360 [Arthrobacter sp. Hiyo8]|nr:hypothetical protein AHiyo8_36360 [Arthrobacter sp. Hiyo8]GAP59419.1 hypothetical protein AHiyo1_27170 [Arthrobacter sp. Hiyo1]
MSVDVQSGQVQVGDDERACLAVVLVAVARSASGSAFDDDVQSQSGQLRDRLRRRSHTTFTIEPFPRYAKFHPRSLSETPTSF